MIILVLSGGNYRSASNYIKENNNIKHENMMHRELIDVEDNKFIIVDTIEHVRGIHADKYIKAPDYWTLEDEVKSRIGR
jgi:hypothetical protein